MVSSLHAVSSSAMMFLFPGDFLDQISFNATSTSESSIALPDSSFSSSKSNISPMPSNKSPVYSAHLFKMSCSSVTATSPSLFSEQCGQVSLIFF